MKDKLIAFLILLLLAGGFVIAGANKSTIVCNNSDKTCYLQTSNSILKSTNKNRTIEVADRLYKSRSKNYGVSFSNESGEYSFGVNGRSKEYLTCLKDTRKVRSNGSTKTKTRFLLTPTRHKLPSYAINTYTSNAACVADQMVLNNYFNSDKTAVYEHKVLSSHMNVLFYLLAGLFGLFAILVLFKGNAVSSTQTSSINVENEALSEDQRRAMEEKAMGAINTLKNLDASAVDKIADIAKYLGGININKK